MMNGFNFDTFYQILTEILHMGASILSIIIPYLMVMDEAI
uniref:Uncharacterized protein n=1 Tax=Rhizophora mucronata TaxID=61149 RepID=A0A2P2NMN7_RHIMU